MTAFDVLLHGGTLIDGSGAPGVRADVGILGDRILAVGDLSPVDPDGVGLVLDVAGRVVTPGFIDPHGHSDGSLFLDGALASHLHQGFTTQLSGNCGDTLAPITDAGRELVDLSLRANELTPRWTTFGEYLDRVAEQPLGPNVAFLVGHGTVRGSVLGPDARAATPDELAAMVGAVDGAMDAGALGLSTGLIYAPGMHAPADEVEALVAATTRRGGMYATHMRNECDGLFESLDESIAAIRAAGPGGRLQVSHLKCGSRSVWGRADDAVARLELARAEGLDVGADQYPYTAAATTLATILPPALQALGVDDCVSALADPHVRDLVRSEIERGISGWENVASDPGWGGLRISFAASRPEWSGRSLAELADELHGDPLELAFDVLLEDRLDVSVVIECMHEPDVETIMAVAVDRRLHGCRRSSARAPHPRCRPAASADVREHGARARDLCPRARDAAARDRDREAHLRTGRPARPARPRRRPRGCPGRPRRPRSRDRRRRGHLRRAGPLPAGHRARRRQRATGDPPRR